MNAGFIKTHTGFYGKPEDKKGSILARETLTYRSNVEQSEQNLGDEETDPKKLLN